MIGPNFKCNFGKVHLYSQFDQIQIEILKGKDESKNHFVFSNCWYECVLACGRTPAQV